MTWWLEACITILAAYGTLTLVQAGWRWASHRRGFARPLLSIVVIVRNQERIVEGLLNDLLRQSDALPLVNDIIAVDLGSGDSTPAILQRMARQHPEVRSLMLTETTPRTEAFHQAFRLCRHPLTLCLDASRGADLKQLRQALAALLTFSPEATPRAWQQRTTA